MSRWLLLAVFALPLLAAEPKKGKNDFPSPKASVERMKLPAGFRVALVGGEPTFIKPIAMTTDERGRLWVVESHSYPHWLPRGKQGKDRILILTPDGKGGWSSKVFLDKGTNLSGIAVGHGGVWLCAVPNTLFIPVKDDKPTGAARVVLDGWNTKTKHNVVNSLCWGPDGWLYGLNGIQSQSLVGAPGAKKQDRVSIDCGVWRYHPARKKFEAVAWGTTNPWGIDWNDRGELFITNCVIKHLFHVVPGGHYTRMYGQDLNPHTYALMESCADHIHWGGGSWTSSRGGKGSHSKAGGGHAHAGAMFYLGDQWPAKYRDQVFMGNIHGNRINVDRLERSGSAYVAKHCDDFLFAHDDWFRPLILQQGVDGVFIADWHDTGECHNYDKTHPSGRVYHVTWGEGKTTKVDLASLTDAQLVKHQISANEWYVRHARRLLQERALAGKLDKAVKPALEKMLNEEKEDTKKLRALWALYSINGIDDKGLLKLLDATDESVRVWAVRLLVDGGKVSDVVAREFVTKAEKEKSAMVRLAYASALQKMTHKQRWPLAEVLASRTEDAADPYLPLMIWYGIEAAVPGDATAATKLLGKAKMSVVRRYIARRLAALAE